MADTQLDDALIRQLHVTVRAFTKGVNEVMKPLGLYSSEWTVLNFVAKHDSFPQSDIAAALEIEGAAISKTLSKMEQKGLIVRTSSQDKREKRISLTEKGRELYPLAAQAAGNHRSAVLAGLSRDDRQQMLSFIQSMLDHIHSD
ncbi:MarR family transcriptional regulator [Megasphaera butyrica]|uniref:MarR family winged helix-turn-helix transcriptional regulator n=1 Tax=Megasphaera TaxID=906 RepID=UPI000820EFC7|nr:MarR family transcriptional regulator [Megasphaera butyrica]MCU6713500.1 MarR family transcriptional regulator [Megasphaera butyrica]SCH02458.1 Salmolysin [uncultured Megasphaera sp.]SCI13707.1 Salmolysin [uncultured Ruminococcus sp.]